MGAGGSRLSTGLQVRVWGARAFEFRLSGLKWLSRGPGRNPY